MQGVENVSIDEGDNVVYSGGLLTEFMAHTDVVFPDTDLLPVKEENGRFCAPGVGDDTANLVVLLMAAKYLTEKKITPRDVGLLLVANPGDEGLGNLGGRYSLGCLGCYVGDGAHTREEWIEWDSLGTGMQLALDLMLDYCRG